MLERLIIVVSTSPSSDGPTTARDPALSAADRRALDAEFPDIEVEIGAQEPSCFTAPPITVRAGEWTDPAFDLGALDARVAALAAQGPFCLCLSGPSACDEGVALQVLTRYQRFMGRRNRASQREVFDHVLSLHRELHDVDRPLVRADRDHALDTWQWMLRLDPRASLAAQVAALFHDIERLVSEADVRVEHRAKSYQDFKDAHARRGAELARAALASTGLDPATLDRVDHLIAQHERPQGDAELALLNDADALSFFSLNSSGFLDYFGLSHTRRKVAYSWGRLRPEARARLRLVRVRPEIKAMIAAELAATEAPAERRAPLE